MKPVLSGGRSCSNRSHWILLLAACVLVLLVYFGDGVCNAERTGRSAEFSSVSPVPMKKKSDHMLHVVVDGFVGLTHGQVVQEEAEQEGAPRPKIVLQPGPLVRKRIRPRQLIKPTPLVQIKELESSERSRLQKSEEASMQMPVVKLESAGESSQGGRSELSKQSEESSVTKKKKKRIRYVYKKVKKIRKVVKKKKKKSKKKTEEPNSLSEFEESSQDQPEESEFSWDEFENSSENANTLTRSDYRKQFYAEHSEGKKTVDGWMSEIDPEAV